MSRRANVVFLLHMHQPQYVDPRTQRAELPWVRLHGARAYLDVARVLDDYPRVQLTVNFVPSLLVQLSQVVAGARDSWLDVAARHANDWTPEDRELLVTRLFSVNWSRAVDPRPRYRELLDKRGRHVRTPELAARARAFSDGELRDLTVLFNLAWIGFAARAGDRELDELERKGRSYDRADFELVIERQRAACARVLPAWRKLAERGQVELSSSPFYHPILPLVIDSEAARRARPDLALPARYAAPDDAREQIDAAKMEHVRHFGAAPAGMWPPEGSISPEAIAAYRDARIGWLATDEGNLWRSLGRDAPRGELYRAYRASGVDLVFRDRELSDRIGFAYAHGDSAAGAHDLLARARDAAAQSTAPDGEPALVPIFLDGENPWEAYPGGGEPFLRALCDALDRDPHLRARSIGAHLGEAPSRVELAHVHSGSWIDSDFHIWIGDPIKNRAWELLGRVRRAVERAPERGARPEQLARAREHLLAAEGSDWFWWFGEPFHSAEDALFDRLFRAHLAGALAALGEPIFEELERPVAPDGHGHAHGNAHSPAAHAPTAFIRPRIAERAAGRHETFYEWHGAGRFDVPRGAAMADTPLVERVRYGFDPATLYVRVEPSAARAAELDGATLEIEIELAAGARRLVLRARGAEWQLADAGGAQLGAGGPAAVDATAAGRALEIGVTFARLGVAAGDRLELALRLVRDGVVMTRVPQDGTLAVTVPDAAFEAENWSA
jgi:alpha-amylase/alpha-mannosidase (GH57 family)